MVYCASALVASVPISSAIQFLTRYMCNYILQNSMLKELAAASLDPKKRWSRNTDNEEKADRPAPSTDKMPFVDLYHKHLGPRVACMMAAKISYMQVNVDSRKVVAEVRFIQGCYQINSMFVSDPRSERMIRNLAPKELTTIRESGMKISDNIACLKNVGHKEIYILREYFLHAMSPLQRFLFRDNLVGAYDDIAAADPVMINIYRNYKEFFVFLLIAIFAVELYVIFILGNVAMSYAPAIYISLIVASCAADALIISPVKISIQFLVTEMFVSRKAHSLKHAIELRTKSIYKRKTGHFWFSNSLVQHFNPAVRAARNSMQLSVSKLLVCLNDSDFLAVSQDIVPASLQGHLDMIEMILSQVLDIALTPFYALPRLVNRAIVDIIAAVVLAFVLLTTTSSISIYLSIILLLIPLGLFSMCRM